MKWLVALFLLVSAGGGAFLAFRSPTFWAGLASHVWNALAPMIFKRKSPEDEALDQADYRANTDRKKPFGKGGKNA